MALFLVGALASGLPDALTLRASQASEVWGNLVGGARREVVYTGLLTLTLELDLDEAGWLDGASMGATGIFVQGDNISRAVGDAGVLSNLAGRQTVRIFRAWYRQQWLDERLDLKVGLIPVDDDFMVVKTALLFSNSGFGTLQTFALTLPSPIYPLTALGLRLVIQPADHWTLKLGAYDGSAGSERRSPFVGDLTLSSDQAATLLVELTRSLPEGVGSLSLGSVTHLCRLEDQSGRGRERGLQIVYLMMEHRIFRWAGGSVLAFGHASVAVPVEQAVATAYVDGGFVLEGAAWERPADRLGLGATWTRFGADYLDRRRAAGDDVTSAETLVELTYAASLLQAVDLQGSLQWVHDPHAGTPDALVVGLRVRLEL